MNRDTILLFQEPERYFFPHMKGIAYAPFRIRNQKLRYWLYLAAKRFPFLCAPFLFGRWKHLLANAQLVVFFDFGYVPGIERYIRRKNPDCRVCLFYWNIISKNCRNLRTFSDPDSIYSTDRKDCKKYGLHYNHIFYYSRKPAVWQNKCANHLYFLGLDKGRGAELLKLKKLLEAGGLICDIQVFCESHNRKYKDSVREILIQRPIPYPEYCRRLETCGILLDINQPGQAALSLRVMEAVFFNKKLITSNHAVSDCSFYHPDNILLLKRHTTPEEIREFASRPFHPYGSAVRRQYGYQHWKEQFLIKEHPL